MRKVFTLILIGGLLFSCDMFKDDPILTPPPSLSEKVDQALYSIPVSLTGGNGSATGSARASYVPITGSGDLSSIYNLLSNYLLYADDVRETLSLFITELITSQDLGNLVPDTIYVLDGVADEPTGVALMSGETYDYDLQLYLDELLDSQGAAVDTETIAVSDSSTEASLKIQFNEESGGVSGRAWFSFSDTTTLNDTTGEYSSHIDIFADFDSTASTDTLSIRLFINTPDTSEITGSNDILDYNYRPDKLLLDLSKTGSEISISGTSYHPRAQDNADWVFSDVLINNGTDGPAMYSFTAYAQIGTGALINLALPPTQMSDVSGIWNSYHLGELWGQVVISELNDVLADLGDSNDATIPEGFTGNQYVQQLYAAYILDMILQFDSISSQADYETAGTDFTLSDYNEARAFWDNTTMTNASLDWGEETITLFDDIDSLLADNTSDFYQQTGDININYYMELEDDGSIANLGQHKENLYFLMTAPMLINSAGPSGINWTLADSDIDAIIAYASNGDSTDPWAAGLYDFIEPCIYMINPAIFSDADGLIGSYNSINDNFYGLPVLGAEPAYLQTLLDLQTSLDGVNVMIPQQVFNSSFTMGVEPAF